jgi:molecular chaperone HscB
MANTYGTDDLNKILRQNCFEVFGLPLQYNIDQSVLSNKYQELQKQLHPDKFINHPDSLLSVKVSAHINDAYTTLKSPLLIAIALLHLKGITFDLNIDKELPKDFLMEQMDLYEEIEDASHDIEKLKVIANKLVINSNSLIDKIAYNFVCVDSCLNADDKLHKNNLYSNIIEDIKKLAFYNKLIQQIDKTLEQLW